MEDIIYAIDLYLDGLSLRKVSKTLSRFVKISHTAISDWIHKYQPKRLLSKTKKIDEYIVDETLIKVGSELIWFWIAIEPENRRILALTISTERNMLIADRFWSGLVKLHRNIPYQPEAVHCIHKPVRFLGLEHHIHSSFEKSIIKRTIQYFKDRTKSFDDYFHVRWKNKLKQVKELDESICQLS